VDRGWLGTGRQATVPAEFPDMSALDLEERRELEASEQAKFADMGLPDLEAERGRRRGLRG
jgi:hypothetical protein